VYKSYCGLKAEEISQSKQALSIGLQVFLFLFLIFYCFDDVLCLREYFILFNMQPGLSGINLGKFLIKRVVDVVKKDMPNICVSYGISSNAVF